jgi:hypothetical protein
MKAQEIIEKHIENDGIKEPLMPQIVIDQYVDTCSILKETALSGDYRKGNREGKK